ncbi:cellulose synthase operon protein D [Klebsiella pneumoniae]|nr:cellulose synthase operon protein D [Klebsiella pneumoniae]
MMTENNNPVVMTWFQQQQTPAGWFDLLIIMIEGMLRKVRISGEILLG